MNLTLLFDWRASWSRRVFEALTQGLNDLDKDMPEHWEGTDLCEHAEHLLGVAFVVVQTHVIGFAAALETCKPQDFANAGKRWGLLKNFGRQVGTLSVRQIELAYHLGNYYKHHEEWSDWNETEKSKHTIQTLSKVGIGKEIEVPFRKETEFPCCTGAEILGITKPGEFDLKVLLHDLRDWHEAVLEHFGLPTERQALQVDP